MVVNTQTPINFLIVGNSVIVPIVGIAIRSLMKNKTNKLTKEEKEALAKELVLTFIPKAKEVTIVNLGSKKYSSWSNAAQHFVTGNYACGLIKAGLLIDNGIFPKEPLFWQQMIDAKRAEKVLLALKEIKG